MIAKIFPGSPSGVVKIPPSKSMSHRAIICAALSKGSSRIDNVAYSEDIITTINGMRSLGAIISTYDDYVDIQGIKDFQHPQTNSINCGESGSTLRFFIPIFSLCEQAITFTGKGRLMQRPQKVFEDIFVSRNLLFHQTDDKIETKGALPYGDYQLKGNVSSQFISGLLFTLPLLKGDSSITISEPFESRSYVDLTIQMLSYFGINVEFTTPNTIFIRGNQVYTAKNYTIEGDYSQLAFFAVLAALNNTLEITGVNHDSLQGDKEIISILQNANIHIDEISNGYRVHKSEVRGSSIDLSNCPDLGPILTVLGAYATGETKIYNAERLRIKESDRILAMETELKKLGVAIRSDSSTIFIKGCPSYVGGEAFHGHNDHRIVMSMVVAATLGKKSSTVDDAQAINKSYPQFYDDIGSIGIEVELYE